MKIAYLIYYDSHDDIRFIVLLIAGVIISAIKLNESGRNRYCHIVNDSFKAPA